MRPESERSQVGVGARHRRGTRRRDAMATGTTAYQLINRLHNLRRELQTNTWPLHIAKWPTPTREAALLTVRELDAHIHPYVLKSTPPGFTVGYRCMETGYSFVWPEGQNTFYEIFDGNVIY